MGNMIPCVYGGVETTEGYDRELTYMGVDVTLSSQTDVAILRIAIDVADDTGRTQTATISYFLDLALRLRGKRGLLPLVKVDIAAILSEELPFLTVDQIDEVQIEASDLLESFLPR